MFVSIETYGFNDSRGLFPWHAWHETYDLRFSYLRHGRLRFYKVIEILGVDDPWLLMCGQMK